MITDFLQDIRGFDQYLDIAGEGMLHNIEH